MPRPCDDDLADLVDLGVGGGVDLEDVHVAPVGDLDAGVAGAARIGGRALLAVQRARQDARRRGLADAARAGEDERLRDPLRADGVAQRLRDAALPDDVIEPLRAPFASENLKGHEGGMRMPNAGMPSDENEKHAPDRDPEGLRHSAGST